MDIVASLLKECVLLDNLRMGLKDSQPSTSTSSNINAPRVTVDNTDKKLDTVSHGKAKIFALFEWM